MRLYLLQKRIYFFDQTKQRREQWALSRHARLISMISIAIQPVYPNIRLIYEHRHNQLIAVMTKAISQGRRKLVRGHKQAHLMGIKRERRPNKSAAAYL